MSDHVLPRPAVAGGGVSAGAHPRSVHVTSRTGVYGLPKWFVPALCGLVVEVFALIALGGSVRLMNAGLACPDWPLCFGDVIPDYHPQVYFEFIHRAMAGLVSMTTAVLVFVLLRSSAPRVVKRVAVGAVVLLLTQVVFGGLTVLLQLHAKVVAAHLGMGVGFFSLLLWIYLSVKRAGEPVMPIARWASRLSVALLIAVYGQILLGGLVASHYASLVCTDFPTCHGQWFPTFSGIIGLHVIHRLGAYTLFTFILVSWLALRKSGNPRLKMLGGWMFALVCLQVCIGIANVVLLTPPLIAVAHLSVGTAVLSVAVRLLFETNRPTVAA